MKLRKTWNEGLRFPWSRHGARSGGEVRIIAIVFTKNGTRMWLCVTPMHVRIRVTPPGVHWSSYEAHEQHLRWRSNLGKLPLSRGAKMVETLLLQLGDADLYEAWDMDACRPMIRIDADFLTSTPATSTVPA